MIKVTIKFNDETVHVEHGGSSVQELIIALRKAMYRATAKLNNSKKDLENKV